MVAEIDPLNLADVADRVDSLVAATGEATVKLVTLGVKDLVLANEEGLSEVPRSRLAVLSDLAPDLIRLLGASLGDIAIALEILAVLGSDDCSEKCGCE